MKKKDDNLYSYRELCKLFNEDIKTYIQYKSIKILKEDYEKLLQLANDNNIDIYDSFTKQLLTNQS